MESKDHLLNQIEIDFLHRIKNSNIGSAEVVSWCSGFLIPATDNTTSKKKKWILFQYGTHH